jgi:RND family efflux transporter MFP subunit
MTRNILIVGGVVLLAATAAIVTRWPQTVETRAVARQESRAIAVEAAAVTTADITDVREFTGTLRAADAFTVAPKTGGRIERIHVDIGDQVTRGDVVVELDAAEARQSVAAAEAALAVARAEQRQAETDAELAGRELRRIEQLAQRNLASDVELDTARARAETRRAAVAVAEARVTERLAQLATEQVRLDYTTVRADWSEGLDTRVVGERMVNAGDTVAANTPLLSVLGIDQLTVVVYAPERDYARLAVDQPVTLVADALPEREFTGRIERIAPRFEEQSRQARFEVAVANEDGVLKPGMFVTVRVIVDRAEDATLVPIEALVRREGRLGVYRIEAGEPPIVRFAPVTVGIEGARHAQIVEPLLDGRVVTLGQQLLEDGAPVTIAGSVES